MAVSYDINLVVSKPAALRFLLLFSFFTALSVANAGNTESVSPDEQTKQKIFEYLKPFGLKSKNFNVGFFKESPAKNIQIELLQEETLNKIVLPKGTNVWFATPMDEFNSPIIFEQGRTADGKEAIVQGFPCTSFSFDKNLLEKCTLSKDFSFKNFVFFKASVIEFKPQSGKMAEPEMVHHSIKVDGKLYKPKGIVFINGDKATSGIIEDPTR